MKMKCRKADPAWSRSSANTKAKRASRRLLFSSIKAKHLADIGRVKPTICSIRTVELLPTSTQFVGQEPHKLFFAMALGLLPNCASKSTVGPMVAMKRLNPAEETQARAKTKERVLQVFKRQMESLQAKVTPHPEPRLRSSAFIIVPSCHAAPLTTLPLRRNHDIVEIVDLASDDEISIIETGDKSADPVVVLSKVPSQCVEASGGFRANAYLSQQGFVYKPPFKTFTNNQNASGKRCCTTVKPILPMRGLKNSSKPNIFENNTLSFEREREPQSKLMVPLKKSKYNGIMDSGRAPACGYSKRKTDSKTDIMSWNKSEEIITID